MYLLQMCNIQIGAFHNTFCNQSDLLFSNCHSSASVTNNYDRLDPAHVYNGKSVDHVTRSCGEACRVFRDVILTFSN